MVSVKNVIKSKKAWAVAAGLFLAYGAGVNGAEIDLQGKKVDYEQITKKIEVANQELKKKQEELKAQDQRLNQRKAEVDQALALADKKDEITKELDAKTKELDNKKTELNTLNSNIQAKQAELEKLENIVAAKKEEPKTLPAGDFTVGADVPAGRYKVVPVGHGSNFIVYGSLGDLKVNTILGNDFLSEKEYIFSAEDGDKIHSEAKVKLIPVE